MLFDLVIIPALVWMASQSSKDYFPDIRSPILLFVGSLTSSIVFFLPVFEEIFLGYTSSTEAYEVVSYSSGQLVFLKIAALAFVFFTWTRFDFIPSLILAAVGASIVYYVAYPRLFEVLFHTEWRLGGVGEVPIHLVLPLISTFLFLVISFQSNRSGNPISPIGGQASPVISFKETQNEPLRFAASLAAVGRLPGISQIESEHVHPCLAEPFPLDIDLKKILDIAEARQGDDWARGFTYAGIGIVAVCIEVVVPSGAGIIFAVVSSALYFFGRLHDDKYVMGMEYAPGRYRPSKMVGPDNISQNVVIFRGDEPFRNFGEIFGSWTITVDGERPAQNDLSEEKKETGHFDVESVERRISCTLERSGMTPSAAKVLYFIQGKSVPHHLKRPGAWPPAKFMTKDLYEEISDAGLGNRVRRYLWVARRTSGREVTVSYFIRVSKENADINLEIFGVLMPPIAWRYRWIDRVMPKSGRQLGGDLGLSILGGPIMIFLAPLLTLAQISASTSRVRKASLKAIRESVDANPEHDCGAPDSIRRRLCDFGAISYFLNVDRRMVEIAFTGRILRAFTDELEACSIDTTELREQRATVLNQGIILQGGDLNAENVSAGKGAQSQKTVNVLRGKGEKR